MLARLSLLLPLTLFLAYGALGQPVTLIPGFGEKSLATELKAEAAIPGLVNKGNIDTWLKYLSAKPRHLGSPYGKETAEWMVKQLQNWGYDAHIERYYILFPTPKQRLLEVPGNGSYKAKLTEPPIPGDRTSSIADQGGLPTYNAYSIDGDVTGQLVFVNYGTPKDYEELERYGISVKGKIVIAKYGGSWRGIKPKVAAEKGAIGCLIYSDPQGDGYARGEALPQGGWRPEFGVQRGSVQDMPLYPGDPSTPFKPSLKDTPRLPLKDITTLTKIPVLPISYEDALPLLKLLSGPVATEAWRGALPITYHLGPSKAAVHLKLQFNWDIVELRNVIATLKGSTYPDEWVLRGNHHDGWVFGASDPLTGTTAVLEQARIMGELAKKGFQPKRTIMITLWDGEEPGLIGSTEWVEDHAEEIAKKVVVYINSDVNNRGIFRAGGSPYLDGIVRATAQSVTDPMKKMPVLERSLLAAQLQLPPSQRAAFRSGAIPMLAALGSGSDYTPFLQHLGIATLDIGFGGEGSSGGTYHSIYDSYDHVAKFDDPGMLYGGALAELGAKLTLRFANADILPVATGPLVSNIARYAHEVEALAFTLRQEVQSNNELIALKAYEAASDAYPQVSPSPQPIVPEIDFTSLSSAVERLKKSPFAELDADRISPACSTAFNQFARRLETSLMDPNGLPGRPWFQNAMYSPGFYTGYGVKTMPGIREALEQSDFETVRKQIGLMADRLNRLSATTVCQP